MAPTARALFLFLVFAILVAAPPALLAQPVSAKRIPMSYPSLNVGLTGGVESYASTIIIQDEQSFAALQADIERVNDIIQTTILPEIMKEFDEKRDIYSNNYVEIIGAYYDVDESKLDIIVSKIPPDYHCEAESCAHRIVSVNLPSELKPSQIRQISLGIAVHQNMGPSDDSSEYDRFVDLVSNKAADEARTLISEANNVLEDNKSSLLENDIAIEYLLLRQYSDISRVSVLFGSLDPDLSCSPYCKKPLDVVITSNSNYERSWAYEQSSGNGENEELPDDATSWRFFVVIYEDQKYSVVYLPVGVIKNITATNLGINIVLQSDRYSEIEVAIPKDLLNATNISYDDEGVVPGVFVDKRISEDYTTEPRENDIVFTIPFEAGTEEIQIVGSDIPEFSQRKTTSGGTLDLLLEQEWSEDAKARFKVTFLEGNTVHEHQDYDFRILWNNGSELYSAAKLTDQKIIHNAEGTILVPYQFQQLGNYTIQIYLAGTGIAPTIPTDEVADFEIVVIPEFPLGAVGVTASLMTSILIFSHSFRRTSKSNS